MELQVKGKVIAVTTPKTINDTLTIQQVVVEWFKEVKDKSYSRKTAFELKKTDKFDSMKALNGVNLGDTVIVKFNEPESREYNGQWYTKCEAWGVFKEGASNGKSASNYDDNQDLPF